MVKSNKQLLVSIGLPLVIQGIECRREDGGTQNDRG